MIFSIILQFKVTYLYFQTVKLQNGCTYNKEIVHKHDLFLGLIWVAKVYWSSRWSACVWGRSVSSLSSAGVLSWEQMVKLLAPEGVVPSRLTKESCREEVTTVVLVVMVVALPPEGPGCVSLFGEQAIWIVGNCCWT